MSVSYANAKTVLDLGTYLSYVKKTFSSATSATNADGVNVVTTFSSALTGPQQTTLTALVAAYVDPITGVVDAAQVSLYNSTATALAANGVFTGTWEDVSRRFVSSGVGRAVRVTAACAFATGTANASQLIGIGGTDNGLFFGYNGTSFGVCVRSNSVDTWTAAAAFNSVNDEQALFGFVQASFATLTDIPD
ncbi:hypothetical protein JKP88DRAFT_272962 [Tribonema minus]|uniref:Uncharacterized protein n=1 Tax=Tribonema minus TaxID=303371 RepID=A0A836CEN7_9STRA|nr:hypothetical protein JKP88DRAFT_272962 [Tribonema minus]